MGIDTHAATRHVALHQVTRLGTDGARRDPVGTLAHSADHGQRGPRPSCGPLPRDRVAGLPRVPAAEESLAGRAETIRLHPLTQGELLNRRDDSVTAWLQSGHAGWETDVSRRELAKARWRGSLLESCSVSKLGVEVISPFRTTGSPAGRR